MPDFIDHGDYTEVVIDSGETWNYTLDSGETFENYLINMEASYADWNINMTNDNVTLRNVGVTGNPDSLDQTNHISITQSAGGTAVIDTFYYPGYTLSRYNDAVGTGGTQTPIYVGPGHAGTLEIYRAHCRSTPDNNFRTEPPGHHDRGAQGAVHIYDSYAFRTGAGGFRLGNDNGTMTVENSMADGDHGNADHPNSRPLWAYYWETHATDCTFINGGGAGDDVMIGASAHDPSGHQAEAYLDNCYYEGIGYAESTNEAHEINGSPRSTPLHDGPEDIDGLPLSPEEAASGDGTGEDPGDPEPPALDEYANDETFETWADGSAALDLYRHETDEYTVATTSDALVGDNMLRVTDHSWGRLYQSDIDGPSRGGSFAQSIYIDTANDDRANVHWALQPNNERYIAGVNTDAGEFELFYHDPDSGATTYGSLGEFSSSDVGGWHDIVVDYGETETSEIHAYLTAGVNDNTVIATSSLEHTTLDSGGWGYTIWTASETASDVGADNLRAITLGESEPDDPDEYSVVEVNAGEQRDIYVEDETYENVLIDITADGCTAKMHVSGNSTVRNVGWLGQPDYNDNGDFLMLISGSGDVTIENVYMNGMGDGSPGTYHGGMYLGVGFSGHVEARHNYVAGMGNNGFYANMPADSGGGGGTIAFRNCYHENNTPANIRPGATGSVVEHCLSVVDDPAGERGRYYSNDSQLCRAFWHWDGTPMEIRDSCAYVNPDDVQPSAAYIGRNQHGDADHVELNVNDSYINNDAPSYSAEDEVEGSVSVNFSNLTESETSTVLEGGGVPLSASDAAQGLRSYPDPFDEGIDDDPDDPDDGDDDDGDDDEPTGSWTFDDEYHLFSTSGDDSNSLIARTDAHTTSGESYVCKFQIDDGSEPGFGVVFGAQTASWSSFSGYLVLFQPGANETRLDRWENGSLETNDTTSAVPTGEPLRLKIDYRDTTSAVDITVTDQDNSVVAELSLGDDTTFSEGYPGFYQWRADPIEVYSYEHVDYTEDDDDPDDPDDDPVEGDIDGYRIFVDGDLTRSVTSTVTDVTISDLEPETTYDFEVVTVRDGLESDPATTQATTEEEDVDAPAAPSGLTTYDVTHNSVELEWTHSADQSTIDQYNVYVDGEHNKVVSSSNNTATVDGLEPDTSYSFGVTAERDGLESSQTTTSTVTDSFGPPQNLDSPFQSETGVDLVWDHSPAHPDIDGYHIYFDGIRDHSVSADVTEATVSGLSPGTEYTFEVTAYRGDDETDPATILASTEESEAPEVDLDEWHAGPAARVDSPQTFSQQWPTENFDIVRGRTYEYTLHATDRLGEAGYIGDIRTFTVPEEDDDTDPDPDPDPDPETGTFEDFTHQNIDGYYTLNTDGYRINTLWSTAGDVSCGNETLTPGRIIADGSSHDFYPSAGDTIRFDLITADGTSDVDVRQRFRFLFGVTDDDTYFDTYIDVGQQAVYAFERRNGNWTTLDQGSCHYILGNTSFYGEINWLSSTEYTVEYFDRGTGNSISDRLHATASNHATQHGLFGFAMRSGETGGWGIDNLRVVE